MPNKIQIKRTTVTGRTPNTTNSGNSQFIDTGELALNLTDGKMFSSNGIAYFEVGANLNSIAVGGTFTANSTLVNAAALNVVNRTNTATLYVTTSANVGTAAVINSTSFTHTGRINANSGIKIGSGYSQYETIVAFGSDVAGTWRKIAEVSLVSAQYSTAAFKVDIIDPNVNHGDQSNSWKPDILTYYVSCVRQNDVVTDTPDQCYVRGPANHIRAVKTGTGNYEIQIANEAINRDYFVKIQCYVENANDNGGITFFNGSTAGSTGTAQYDAVVGSSINFFESINIGNSSVRIFANSTTINVGTIFSVNSSTLVVNSTSAVGTLIKVSHTSTGNILVIEDESSETSPLVIDASGYVVLGSNTAPAVGTVGTSRITAAGAAADLASIGIFRNDETAGPAALTFGKTRVTTSNLAINDVVGRIEAAGNDGTDNRTPLSRIEFVVDGATSLDDMPGRIVLSTTADGASAVTERMRLDSTGLTTVNTNLYVVSSANVASAFLANSTGAYHTGTMNAASHTVGTNFTSNSSQMVLNAPSYTVSFSNTNGSATNYITWSTSLQQAVPSVTTRSLGTKLIFYDGLSGSTTDWAYGLAGSEMWASVGTTTGTFRWYAVTTAFMTSNTSFLNHTAQVRVGGGVGTTNGVAITNTSITVGNTVTNSFMTPSTLQIGSSITANATSANLLVNTAISAIIANGSIGTSGQVLTSNSTGIYWSTVSGGGGGSVTKYSANIGNGSATSITVNHNLNSDNVFVTVIENSTGYYVYPDIKYSTSNSTIFEFVDAPTTNQYKVIVL